MSRTNRNHCLAIFACLLLPLSLTANPNVYRKVAPSTVWFFERGSATGILVDVQNRLVLTAEHVVRSSLQAGKTSVQVIFAQVDGNGNALTEKSYYGYERKLVLAIKGTIIKSNRMKDMALIQLEKIPPGVQAIALAGSMPQPGDNVHVLGNSTYSHGGLFSYSTGKVRNSYFLDRFGTGDSFFSLAHHAPTNRGDSGGPVVNDNGELIGIISSGTTGSGSEQVIDHSVHIKEIRLFLEQANLPVIKSINFSGTTSLTSGRDRFFFPVVQGKKVSLNLKGNGASDLDLWALNFDAVDKSGKHITETLVKETGDFDQEKGSFSPKGNFVCQVEVVNVGDKNNFSLSKKNTYSLDFDNQDALVGPIMISRNIAASSSDSLRVQFQASQARSRIFLRGDGDTDLDLFVVDPNGKEIIKEVGTTDREYGVFTVPAAGVYTIRVLNNSQRQFNNYVLWID